MKFETITVIIFCLSLLIHARPIHINVAFLLIMLFSLSLFCMYLVSLDRHLFRHLIFVSFVIFFIYFFSYILCFFLYMFSFYYICS